MFLETAILWHLLHARKASGRNFIW